MRIFTTTYGLSVISTPQREYDKGFEDHVVPVLGPVIFEYDYARAYKDGVVAPFDLVNVRVDLLAHEQAEYDRLTKRAAMLLKKARTDAGVEERLKRVLQMRAAVSAMARMRIPVAATRSYATTGRNGTRPTSSPNRSPANSETGFTRCWH